jgi:hypothetical protein
MAISFLGGTTNQTELEKIQEELYAESFTFRDGLVEIDQGHKSGTDVYESSATVTASAATTTAVTATGDIALKANKTAVSLVSFQFEDTMDDNVLKGTRFERSMARGAFNVVSSEFDQKVLIQVSGAIGETVENMIWNGANAAQKTAIAALTAGAAQGNISAGAQTLAAAMPTNLVNSLPATILYNNSQAKATPGAGLGDYRKVLSIATVTAASIAAEYSKAYLASDSKIINSMTEKAEIFAPLADRQLIKTANNAVGAAQQVNFLVEGDNISYNGHKINFVPLVGFRIIAIPSYMKILCDLTSDVSSLEIDRMANGSRQRFIKNVQTMTTWVVGQKYITLYGG